MHGLLPALLSLIGCDVAPVELVCANGEPLCETRPLARGIDIERILAYQGVELELMANGVATEGGLPLVAGRDALIRLMIEVDDDFVMRPVVGRLFLMEGGTTIAGLESRLQVPITTIERDLTTSINFEVPAELLRPEMSMLFWVLEDTEEEGTERRGVVDWPGNETGAPITMITGLEPLRIHLVPVQYDADGSGRLPDTSDEQVRIYRDLMYGTYPVPSVEIEVGDPLPWSGQISASGSGWSEVLSRVADERQARGLGGDVYMYGVFEPSESLGQFCGAGCVLGLSNFASSPNDSHNRSSVGLGYAGEESGWTMVHEIGHAHGRNHADCGGATGIDPDFPYDGASIGVMGYDPVSRVLKEPDRHTDFMSYCSPNWLSDYTFGALLDRVEALSGVPGSQARQATTTYHSAYLDLHGRIRWSDDLVLTAEPGGSLVAVEALGDGGSALGTITGFYTPFGDLPGGRLLIPADGELRRVRFEGSLSDLR